MTVANYLAKLPADQKKTLSTVRKLIRANLPKGIKETFNWGMISYEVPLKTFAETYNGKPLMFAGLAAKKNYFAIHLVGLYLDPKAARSFQADYKKAGKKLDMGKGCLRFRELDDLALKVLAKYFASMSLKSYLAAYQSARKSR